MMFYLVMLLGQFFTLNLMQYIKPDGDDEQKIVYTVKTINMTLCNVMVSLELILKPVSLTKQGIDPFISWFYSIALILCLTMATNKSQSMFLWIGILEIVTLIIAMIVCIFHF
jgi:hypothetical protein